jgi:nucleotide-binding universal stress UspA family protein
MGTLTFSITLQSDRRHSLNRGGNTKNNSQGGDMKTANANRRMCFSNILLATDFSKTSEKVLPYASALARHYEGKISLLHVLDPEPHLSVPLDVLPVEADHSRMIAEEDLGEFCQLVPNNLLQDTIVKRGDVSAVIGDVVNKNEINLVVVGTHGREGLAKLLLGSDAESIYRNANCPVLAIGPNVAPLERRRWKIRTILFPTDGSESSLAGLPFALSLAEENEACLIALQLMPFVPADYREGDEASARETLRLLFPPEAKNWCKPEFIVRFEFPAEGIVRLAREREADLIVMGIKRSPENTISGHSPWAVASQVVAEANCPVLTVCG